MNIQFVHLENDVCGRLNQAALQQRRTVSDLVNEILRDYLARSEPPPADATASSDAAASK
jgi:hypothetical protein